MYTFSVSADVCIVVLYCNVLYFIFVLQSFVVLQPASGCTAGCVILVCCTVVLLYHCVVLLTQYLSITFRDVLPACCLSVNRTNTFPTTHTDTKGASTPCAEHRNQFIQILTRRTIQSTNQKCPVGFFSETPTGTRATVIVGLPVLSKAPSEEKSLF